MQLLLPTMERQNSIITPLKYQLLKWIGNKQRYARDIIELFPNSFNRYYEPFLGSGAVLASLAPERGVGSDVFPPLIEIWRTLKNDPTILKKWYRTRWDAYTKGDNVKEYEKIKASYNVKPNGADLLFLCRSCYGGVVRFRKSDGYMSTPCGIHQPITPISFNKRVEEWYQRIKHCDFRLLDYREAMENAKANDLIYCDPPYLHSQGILYGAQVFSIEDLFNQIDKCKRKGVKVALSIDGVKKSGNYKCSVPIPKGLFEREIFVDCGRSMLRRFQMIGESLENEVVHDRLLLTY